MWEEVSVTKEKEPLGSSESNMADVIEKWLINCGVGMALLVQKNKEREGSAVKDEMRKCLLEALGETLWSAKLREMWDC